MLNVKCGIGDYLEYILYVMVCNIFLGSGVSVKEITQSVIHHNFSGILQLDMLR